MQVTPNGRARRAEGEWRQIVSRWERSGQSGRDFCRKEGIQLSSFHRWRRRLLRASVESDFVTVTPVPPATPTWTLEVTLPSGGTLRFRG